LGKAYTYLRDREPQMAEAERIIEKSVRRDGTLRKEVRVRPGFKSEELDLDTRAYHSKGAIRKAELEGYVPGSAPQAEAKKMEGGKRKERRQRKKDTAQNGHAEEEDEQDDEKEPVKTQTPAPEAKKSPPTTAQPNPTQPSQHKATPTAVPKPSLPAQAATAGTTNSATTKRSGAAVGVTAKLEKASLADEAGSEGSSQLRKLQKLLRQITQLEEDAKGGKPLTPEQQAKLARKKEIESQIAGL